MSKSIKLKNNNFWDSKGIVHNQKLLSDILDENTPISYNNIEANDSIRYLQVLNVELGGIYSIAMSYCFNTQGSLNYRATLYAILTINCGYNGSQVVVRPKLNIISNYYQTPVTADPNITVICEGGGTEIDVNSFLNNPNVYIYYTNTTYPGKFKIKIEKIV